MAKAFVFGANITAPWHQQQATQTIAMTAEPTHWINPCVKPFSLSFIPNFPYGSWEYKTHYTSSGDLCCNLCYASEINCVLADFNEYEDTCLLKINKVIASEWPTELCPLGVYDQDTPQWPNMTKPDFWGLIPGPCLNLSK